MGSLFSYHNLVLVWHLIFMGMLRDILRFPNEYLFSIQVDDDGSAGQTRRFFVSRVDMHEIRHTQRYVL